MAVRFRHHGVCLVRSTTDPGDLDLPHDLDLSDLEAVEAEGRAWLAKTWARGEVRESIALASPDLQDKKKAGPGGAMKAIQK